MTEEGIFGVVQKENSRGFVDAKTLADSVYDGLLRITASIIARDSKVRLQSNAGSFVPIIPFTDSPKVVKDCDDAHNAYNFISNKEWEPALPEDVAVTSIAYESDDGVRVDRAWLKYTEGFILPLKDSSWFISRGISRGGYLSTQLYGDISAVPIIPGHSSIDDTVKQLSEPWFRNSLIIVKGDQDLGLSKFATAEYSRFAPYRSEIEETLRLGINSSEIDSKYPTYHPTTADPLANILVRILERTPIPIVAETER